MEWNYMMNFELLLTATAGAPRILLKVILPYFSPLGATFLASLGLALDAIFKMLYHLPPTHTNLVGFSLGAFGQSL